MKFSKKILNNQSGISLIEITIAAAMSVVISLGIMKINQVGQKGVSKVTSDIDLKLWQSIELMPLLGDSLACAWAMSGQAPGSTSINTNRNLTEIRRVTRNTNGNVNGLSTSDNRRLAFIGKNIGSHLSITSITHLAFAPDGTGSTGSCNLQIIVSKKNSKQSFGSTDKTINIPMECRVNNLTDKYLTSCQSSAGTNTSLWQHAYSATPEYISSSKDVLIGTLSSSAAGLEAPLQVSSVSNIDFADVATNVKQAIKIDQQNAGLMIGNYTTVYEDTSGCTVIANTSTGDIETGYKDCGDGLISLGLNSPANVGIGTSNPTATLHVNGNAMIESDISLNGTVRVNKIAIAAAISSTNYTASQSGISCEKVNYASNLGTATTCSCPINYEVLTGGSIAQPGHILRGSGSISRTKWFTICSDLTGVSQPCSRVYLTCAKILMK